MYSEQIDEELKPLPTTIQLAHQRRFGAARGLGWLSAGTLALKSAHAEILAAAPSDAAPQASAMELARALSTRDAARVSSQLNDDNRASVALHVQVKNMSALLCGDVINHPGSSVGRQPLDDLRHQGLTPVQLVKVAHHGSEEANHQPMWGLWWRKTPR